MFRSDDNRADSVSPMPDPQNGVQPYGSGSGTSVPALPPGMSSTPTAGALLRALKRRWFLALSLSLLVASAAAAAGYFLVPVKYTAKIVVFISGRDRSPFEPDRAVGESNTYQRTQAALVKSRFVLIAALKDPKIADLPLIKAQPDPVEWLETALQTDFKASPEILTVSLSGDRADDVRLILNAVIDAYVQEVVTDDEATKLKKISALRDASRRYEEQLAAKRRTLRDLAEATGSRNEVALAVMQGMLQDRLSATKHDLIDIQRILRNLNQEIKVEDIKVKAGVQPTIPEGTLDEELNRDRQVLTYQMQISQLESDRDKKAPFFKEGINAPKLKEFQGKIDSLKGAMATYRTKRREEIKQYLLQKATASGKDLLQKDRERIAIQKELEKALSDELTSIGDQMKRAAANTVDLDAAKDDLEKVSAVAKRLRDLVETYNLDISGPGRVNLREQRADVRAGQAERRQLLITGGAAGGAFLLVILVVAYCEFLTRRVNTGDDVVYGLGWRLVGALPALPSARRGGVRRGKDDKYWHSILTESVDATRTVLLHAARTEGLRTVMVTSAVSGEGKTSLSCHLATSLARAGRKTLLIDCDLRSPAAHRLFELPADPGVCELLRGEVELADAIRATPANNLWLIPAGQCDAQTLQSLAQDGVGAMLGQLKEQFDFIVVDSSPVLPVADALLIGQNVDVVIFSLLRDVSRIPNVYAAYQRLSTLGIRMLGAVVNGVSRGAYGYSYQDYAKQTS
jgi:capsular exopolysaccharide synthesis family protein